MGGREASAYSPTEPQEPDMKLSVRIAAAALLATSVSVVGTGTALASGGGAETHRGSCSGSTDWKIKAKPDDGRIEVESEIDSNQSGQTWHWVLTHDGDVAARGTSMTRGASGSFEVGRRTDDHAGSDSFRFRAVNGATDEVCVARMTL
jgi:hypothetical protein